VTESSIPVWQTKWQGVLALQFGSPRKAYVKLNPANLFHYLLLGFFMDPLWNYE